MNKFLPLLSGLVLISPMALAADPVTHISMETDGNSKIVGSELSVKGLHRDENMKGAKGYALRLDGYSTYVEGNIEAYEPTGASSFSVWVAPETYPIISHDVPTNEKITLAGTLDPDAKKGWAFSLGKTGKYSFDCYINGWQVTVEASDLLPCYEWSLLCAVNDPVAGALTLYRNGEQVGKVNSQGPIDNGVTSISIGKTKGSNDGLYQLKTFNGLIDDIDVFDGVLSLNEMNATPENEADLTVSAERFADDLLRPSFHGMPSANWTNECHGMTYSDGKYHLFFQKNANGPYMSRLHWGHLSSENLYDWSEEPIAIAPAEEYDIKGCWSGCVFTDEKITDGSPNILYTGVDYVKAYIVQASPTDETLLDWEKKGKVIDGKPAGLSDDFRDPYFFRNGNDAYIIVGTSKDGIGATTLHKYTAITKRWSNDGKIFFKGQSTAQDGTFWEMPNITLMPNGKWLFTVTPQNTSQGVRTLYWTGDINSDGTFAPDFEAPLNLELINGQGYGLLSPTIYQKDGKTILLGIVPDKLPTADNVELGWAHLYSFPREISLDEANNLVQKPYSGLAALRNENGYTEQNFSLEGAKAIAGVTGRKFEVKGHFVVGSSTFGFNLFKNENGAAVVSYNPVMNRLEVNLQNLNRRENDNLNGRYSCQLPEKPEAGSEFILDVWVDGSIMDIFVNDKWATSVRVFPKDTDADGVEMFANGSGVGVNKMEGWMLSSTGGNGNTYPEDPDAGIEDIIQDLPEFVNVYNLNGILVKRNVSSSEALKGLPKGIYLVGDKKIAL